MSSEVNDTHPTDAQHRLDDVLFGDRFAGAKYGHAGHQVRESHQRRRVPRRPRWNPKSPSDQRAFDPEPYLRRSEPARASASLAPQLMRPPTDETMTLRIVCRSIFSRAEGTSLDELLRQTT
jgi:hypothetical protein